MYELTISPNALKTLEQLDGHLQDRILTALERLRIRPESCDYKKLVGMPGYRFRVGDYRIIFDFIENELRILVVKIGHRKNIYD